MTPKELREQFSYETNCDPIETKWSNWLESRLSEMEKAIENYQRTRINGVNTILEQGKEITGLKEELATLRSENEGLKKEMEVNNKAFHSKCQSLELSYTKAQVQADLVPTLTASLAEADKAIVEHHITADSALDWKWCQFCGEVLLDGDEHLTPSACIVLKSQDRQKASAGK